MIGAGIAVAQRQSPAHVAGRAVAAARCLIAAGNTFTTQATAAVTRVGRVTRDGTCPARGARRIDWAVTYDSASRYDAAVIGVANLRGGAIGAGLAGKCGLGGAGERIGADAGWTIRVTQAARMLADAANAKFRSRALQGLGAGPAGRHALAFRATSPGAEHQQTHRKTEMQRAQRGSGHFSSVS